MTTANFDVQQKLPDSGAKKTLNRHHFAIKNPINFAQNASVIGSESWFIGPDRLRENLVCESSWTSF